MGVGKIIMKKKNKKKEEKKENNNKNDLSNFINDVFSKIESNKKNFITKSALCTEYSLPAELLISFGFKSKDDFMLKLEKFNTLFYNYLNKKELENFILNNNKLLI